MQGFPIRGSLRAALSLLIVVVVFCAGCGWLKRSDGLSGIAPIALSPTLRWSPSLTDAVVPYQNACGQPASFPIAASLTDAVPKKLRRVFTGLSTNGGTAQGTIEVAVGLKQIDMAIIRQVKRKYPVTVTLGLDATFFADDGSILFTKKLQSSGYGEVEVTDQSCDVKGLDAVVLESVDLVSEGVAKQMGESVRVKEFAEQHKAGLSSTIGPAQTASTSPSLPDSTSPNAAVSSVPLPMPISPQPSPGGTDRSSEGTALIFRAIVRDENRDHILGKEESLTIEVEVKNDGKVIAKDVEVIVSGTAALTAEFPPVLSIGDLLPGEVKRTTSTKRITIGKEPLRGELVLSLRSATPISSVPLAKKFNLVTKPETEYAGGAVPDVDQPPKQGTAVKSPKALVIAMGVGKFRDAQVPPVTYAGRDAETMGTYLRTITNVPEDRVRVLVDEHALKQDMGETFDEWLPKRADSNTVVYVFFSGRALVDGVTGAVSLVPFDGTTTAANRLYSLRRLQESLSRASIQRAILMFDVSLEATPGTDPSTNASPVWDSGVSDHIEQIMWMVSNHRLQEAQPFEQGKHGLFTYYLLRGLQGIADADRDGTVTAGELCTFTRNQVSRVAKEQFGHEQDPLCLPPPGQGAMVRIHPLAKGNNPKPPAAAKKQEAVEPSGQGSKALDVGPGQ